jgi:hypothetical protein
LQVDEPSGARALELPLEPATRLMLHLAIDSISRRVPPALTGENTPAHPRLNDWRVGALRGLRPLAPRWKEYSSPAAS